jgi:hypothetical protein
MTKQTINTGTSANSRDGDSLRSAFTKINANFTELYDRAVNTDAQTLTLTGNTLSISGGNSVELNISSVGDLQGSVFADDSTLLVDAVNGSIPYSVISGAVDLSAIDQHIIPDTDITYDLGSATNRFRTLYLSGNTIDLGGSLISAAADGTVALPGVSVLYYVPDSIEDYGVFSQPDDWEEFNNDPWEPLTFSDVPVIIDHFTYLLAFYGSLEGPNQADFLAARVGYVPTVYTPIMSNGTSGALTGIVITTPGSYDPSKPETIGIEGVNTDNMIALPAGTDINDWDSLVAAINGEAYPEGYGGIGLGVNMVASTSRVVVSSIPADVGDLTDTGNLLFDGDYTSLSNRPIIPVDIDDLTDTGNVLASELVSVTVPTIGSTASASEAGITYLSGDLSKWAIFTEGAFTVGVWTDVQVGWTVTDNNGFTDTIAGRGSFGAASFQTTVNSWPSPASGKTYVFTSPNYQAGYTNPIEITVGSNDWSFNNNGSVTFPDATVQTTAWTGIPGPYTDDAAAALANVAVGSPYYQVSGQVFVRLI